MAQESLPDSNNIHIEGNNLFPVFLQLHNLRLLIVGGGYVGFEKLQAVINNSPLTPITLVATFISEEIKTISQKHPNIVLIEESYNNSHLDNIDLVIVAINDRDISSNIHKAVKSKGILVNVADKPELCDFYLSSVVKKGNLKIAISTNGQSPTVAKRIKEVLAEALPEQIDDVLANMKAIRQQLAGDFTEKVNQLNAITEVLIQDNTTKASIVQHPKEATWQKIVKWCLFAFFFMILGHTILSFITWNDLLLNVQSIPKYIDPKSFFIMLITGFFAQMVDGSLGMGYGTISTTFLLAYGVNPAIVSSRVHSARVFSSGVSGYSHHRFGNINKKLFKALAIPGVIGAIIGAGLAYFGQQYATYVRLPLSVYTLYLGYFIIKKAFKKQLVSDKVTRAGWLASIGGFMDAFAGGGWGALVTSTLISKRKSPRYVIGSVCLAEFFVVLASSITFFILLKSIPLADIAGLIVGGLIAAPIAARLAGKLPLKSMFIAVGTLVVLISCFTLYKATNLILHPVHFKH